MNKRIGSVKFESNLLRFATLNIAKPLTIIQSIILMKVKSILAVLIVFSQLLINAQITFQKAYQSGYSTWGNSIQKTSDGGYIITGGKLSWNTFWYEALYLVKTDESGHLQWAKSYGEDDGYEIGHSVLQTNDGGYIVIGETSNFGQGGLDIFLIRTNSIGDTLWTKAVGKSNIDVGNSIIETTDGGFILTGKTGGVAAVTGYDIVLIKMDDEGNILWSKTYGGTNHEYAESVEQTTDGGYIIAGYGSSFGSGNWDVFLIKTNDSGNIIWSKTYGSQYPDYGYSVKQTLDEGYIIVGVTAGENSWNAYLIKTDQLGNVSWSKTYDGAQSLYGNSVQQMTDGGYIIAGDVYLGALLIRTTETGVPLWTKAYAGRGDATGKSVVLSDDGGFAITGYTASFPTNDFRDLYINKTDAYGNSGCLEDSYDLTVSDATTLVTSPTFQISTGIELSNSKPVINEGGFETVLCYNVGVQNAQFNKTELSISPNPFSSHTLFQTNQYLTDATLIVYNSFGQKIIEIVGVSGNTYDFKRDNLCSGIYYLQIKDDYICLPLKKLIVVDY